MDQDGKWSLSPAFDVIYAHNPKGTWTNRHQMSVNGKRDNIERKDFIDVANSISLSGANEIVDNVLQAVRQWPLLAKKSGVTNSVISEIESNLLLDI